jgi:hypothetical protein
MLVGATDGAFMTALQIKPLSQSLTGHAGGNRLRRDAVRDEAVKACGDETYRSDCLGRADQLAHDGKGKLDK